MGHLVSKLVEIFDVFSPKNPARILMLGLDAAGKTTILYRIKLNENVTTIPTIGFNVETVEPKKGISFTVWDVGGQDKIRQLWKHYFQNTDGLVYVVDSADKERMQESKEELHSILQCDEMWGVPVIIIANKQDIPRALSPHDVIKVLGLNELKGRKWHVQGTCARTGDGVFESMDELAQLVKDFQKQRRR